MTGMWPINLHQHELNGVSCQSQQTVCGREPCEWLLSHFQSAAVQLATRRDPEVS